MYRICERGLVMVDHSLPVHDNHRLEFLCRQTSESRSLSRMVEMQRDFTWTPWRGFLNHPLGRFDTAKPGHPVGLGQPVRLNRPGITGYRNLDGKFLASVWNKPIPIRDLINFSFTPQKGSIAFRYEGRAASCRVKKNSEEHSTQAEGVVWWEEYLHYGKPVLDFLQSQIPQVYLFSDRPSMFVDETDEFIYASQFPANLD